MKKSILFTILIAMIAITGFSQVPNAFKYQAELRNTDGEVLSNTPITVRVTIVEDARVPINKYRETHVTETNSLGLIHLNIGNGIPELGTMDDILWSEHEYSCQIEVDDGTGYIDMGMTRFLSVPYALQANSTLQLNNTAFKFQPWQTPCMTMGTMQYNIWTNNQYEDLYLQGYNYNTQEGNIHENNTIINHEGGLVGIGNCNPTHKLTVGDWYNNDPIRIFNLLNDDSDSLLVINGSGVVKWRDASTLSGGNNPDMDWEVDANSNILTSHGATGYPTGNVGIGTANPLSLLSIGTDGESIITLSVHNNTTTYGATGIKGEVAAPNYGDWAYAIHGKIESGAGSGVAVFGNGVNATPGTEGRCYGVYGKAGNATNQYNFGVLGQLKGQNSGAAIAGIDEVNHSWNTAIDGGSWAGYFIGRVHVNDELGIATVNPVTTLDINGGVALNVVSMMPGNIQHTDRIVLAQDIGQYFLPSATTYPGLTISVKNLAQSDVKLFPDPTTNEMIDNNINGIYLPIEPLHCYTITSDGSNWWIISKY